MVCESGGSIHVAHSAFHIRSEEGEAFSIGGLSAVIKVRGEATGGVSIVEHSLPPGYLGAAPHRHRNEDETTYVLEGELKVQLEETILKVRPGEFVHKPRGGLHAFWNAGEETVRFLDVITPGGFETYFEALAKLVPVEGPPDIEAILALAESYGLEFDLTHLEEFMRHHGLKLI